MEPEGLRAEAKRLRSAEPARAIRGFDEGQTRKLLEAAADLLNTAAATHEAMRGELEKLRSQAGDEAARKEAIGNAFLAATQAAEEMAAEAHASAERTTTEAESRAAAILEQATAAAGQREQESIAARETLEIELSAARAAAAEENAARRIELERERARVIDEAKASAATLLADARHEIEQLQGYGERLRSLLSDSQRRFVELAESALRQLDGVDAGSGSGHGELLDDLRPTDGEPAPSAAASETTAE